MEIGLIERWVRYRHEPPEAKLEEREKSVVRLLTHP
jgi:hypothetical protein